RFFLCPDHACRDVYLDGTLPIGRRHYQERDLIMNKSTHASQELALAVVAVALTGGACGATQDGAPRGTAGVSSVEAGNPVGPTVEGNPAPSFPDLSPRTWSPGELDALTLADDGGNATMMPTATATKGLVGALLGRRAARSGVQALARGGTAM